MHRWALGISRSKQELLARLKRPEDNHGAEDRNIPLHYATVPGCRVKAEINVRPGAGRSTSRDPQRLD